jgi:hypothetical protein
MRRFTILGLMGLILGVAVAVAALRNADDYWAGGFLLGTALLIGVATLDAFYHSGRRRANRLGFVVFAGGYFTLAFLGLSDQKLAKLPTSWLLSYVHQQVAPPQAFALAYSVAPPVQGPARIRTANSVAVTRKIATTSTTTPSILTQPYNVTSASTREPSTTWTVLFPGAANFDAFSAVGHCLFALAAGALGIVIARRYEANRDQEDRTY